MKVAHCADIHFCEKHLRWVQPAMEHFVDTAIREQCDVAVLAGDIFDHAIGTHEPAFHAALRAVRRLSDAMPVIMCYGTQSHDHPGSLEPFAQLSDEVFVVDQPRWIDLPCGAFFVLPGLNKADPEVAEMGAAEWVRQRLGQVGAHVTEMLRPAGVPTALVTHGTVTGCVTESKHAMVSVDHEFSLETLALAECDVVLLGHIHQHQHFQSFTPSRHVTQIAYPGSLARLVYGHTDQVGFLIWDSDGGATRWTFHETPARNLIDFEFDGPPDMDELAYSAGNLGPDDAVRIRYSIDEEHANSVDKQAIRALFGHCDKLKIDARVNPIQRVRSEAISTATTLADKLKEWASATGSEPAFPALADRLEWLQALDDEDTLAAAKRAANG